MKFLTVEDQKYLEQNMSLSQFTLIVYFLANIASFKTQQVDYFSSTK